MKGTLCTIPFFFFRRAIVRERNKWRNKTCGPEEDRQEILSTQRNLFYCMFSNPWKPTETDFMIFSNLSYHHMGG